MYDTRSPRIICVVKHVDLCLQRWLRNQSPGRVKMTHLALDFHRLEKELWTVFMWNQGMFPYFCTGLVKSRNFAYLCWLSGIWNFLRLQENVNSLEPSKCTVIPPLTATAPQFPPYYNAHFCTSRWTVNKFTLILTSLPRPPLHNGNGH